MTRRRLGRGLDGLLPAMPPPTRTVPNNVAPIESVHPNRDQPRKHFNPAGLAELAASITEHGVLEPILVRQRGENAFEIIAGERRWRAAQQAGLLEVPIFVRELSDTEAFEAALVENLQREELNPIETALAFQRLIQEFGHTQDQVATRVGKDRSTVSNALRLLKLPKSVLGYIQAGDISEGHGRALLGAVDVPAMKRLAEDIIRNRWSVRETERQARGVVEKKSIGSTTADRTKNGAATSANLRDLERRLSHSLGSTVQVKESKKGHGEVSIKFNSYDELDRLIKKLT